MEIKKFEQEEIEIGLDLTVEETPVVEETNVKESDITKFDKFEAVNEAIEYYEDMTLEEKVEHLNERLRNLESRL